MADVEKASPTPAVKKEAKEAPAKKFSRTSMSERLLALQMKKNKARVAARSATEYEAENEKLGGNALRKRERAAAAARHDKFVKELEENGEDAERYARLHKGQEELDKALKRKARKKPRSEDIFGHEAAFRAFKKRRANTEFDKEAYDKQRNDMGDEFYSAQENEDDPELIESLVEEQRIRNEKNLKFSRRRKWDENSNIDFINERNRKFNQKVNRAFDKYTEDIRENLERGTAL